MVTSVWPVLKGLAGSKGSGNGDMLTTKQTVKEKRNLCLVWSSAASTPGQVGLFAVRRESGDPAQGDPLPTTPFKHNADDIRHRDCHATLERSGGLECVDKKLGIRGVSRNSSLTRSHVVRLQPPGHVGWNSTVRFSSWSNLVYTLRTGVNGHAMCSRIVPKHSGRDLPFLQREEKDSPRRH